MNVGFLVHGASSSAAVIYTFPGLPKISEADMVAATEASQGGSHLRLNYL